MVEAQQVHRVRTVVAALVLAAAAAVTTGCASVGRTWQVEFEIDGDGTADVVYYPVGGDPQTLKDMTLPWSRSESIGFTLGVNGVEIRNASAGARCTTVVDGRMVESIAVNSHGYARCQADLR